MDREIMYTDFIKGQGIYNAGFVLKNRKFFFLENSIYSPDSSSAGVYVLSGSNEGSNSEFMH